MESIVDILSQGRDREAQASKIYGFVIGIVTNNQDPDSLCRVKVKFPWLADDVESWWCRCSQPMAGGGRGTMFIPEIDDEVLVGFEHGDVRFPYVIGSLYNGKDAPPTSNDITEKFGGTGYDHGAYQTKNTNEDGKNNIRMFRSRAGHLLLFDDTEDDEKILIVDHSANHRIEIHSKDKRIVITNEDGDMEFITEKKFLVRCEDFEVEARKSGKMDFGTTLDVVSKGDMKLETKGNYTGKAAMNMDIKAGTNMTAKAGVNMTIDGGLNTTAKAGVAMSVQGGATAELKGAAMTTVKGGVVMIN